MQKKLVTEPETAATAGAREQHSVDMDAMVKPLHKQNASGKQPAGTGSVTSKRKLDCARGQVWPHYPVTGGCHHRETAAFTSPPGPGGPHWVFVLLLHGAQHFNGTRNLSLPHGRCPGTFQVKNKN